jgi:hypothetical protein
VVISVKSQQRKPPVSLNRASPDLVSFNGDLRSTLDPRDLGPSRVFEEALDGSQDLARVPTLGNNGQCPIRIPIPRVESAEPPSDEA